MGSNPTLSVSRLQSVAWLCPRSLACEAGVAPCVLARLAFRRESRCCRPAARTRTGSGLHPSRDVARAAPPAPIMDDVPPGDDGRGGEMAERWFSDEELTEMSRPTMDRAIEAIEAGDLERGQGAVRGDEARVALPARHDGRRDRRLDDVGQGALRRGGGGRVAALGDGALLEAQRERDRRARPQGDRGAARRHLARALVQRNRPAAGRLHDRGGRREGDLSDEPMRLGPAAVADGPIRGRATGTR